MTNEINFAFFSNTLKECDSNINDAILLLYLTSKFEGFGRSDAFVCITNEEIKEYTGLTPNQIKDSLKRLIPKFGIEKIVKRFKDKSSFTFYWVSVSHVRKIIQYPF
jgi:hypothetical protein